MNPNDFIAKIAPMAQSSYAATGIYPSFVIVQAIFESSWGGSKLCQQANNLFGIKATPDWTGATLDMPTGEFVNGVETTVPASWRSYPDWLSSISDHAAFLMHNPRYAAAFQTSNVVDFIQAIAAAGYSTNPSYAQMLIDEIHARNLTQFDEVTP